MDIKKCIVAWDWWGLKVNIKRKALSKGNFRSVSFIHCNMKHEDVSIASWNQIGMYWNPQLFFYSLLLRFVTSYIMESTFLHVASSWFMKVYFKLYLHQWYKIYTKVIGSLYDWSKHCYWIVLFLNLLNRLYTANSWATIFIE